MDSLCLNSQYKLILLLTRVHMYVKYLTVKLQKHVSRLCCLKILFRSVGRRLIHYHGLEFLQSILQAEKTNHQSFHETTFCNIYKKSLKILQCSLKLP